MIDWTVPIAFSILIAGWVIGYSIESAGKAIAAAIRERK